MTSPYGAVQEQGRTSQSNSPFILCLTRSNMASFLTSPGDWDAAQRRADATPGAGSDDEVFGDFEDIETGAAVQLSAQVSDSDGLQAT